MKTNSITSRGKYQFETVQPSHWNRKKLHGILDQFQKRKILVIGDIGLDRYTIGIVERISPEAPVPILLVKEEKLKLGLAANVADNIQTLGGVPLLIGSVGNDRPADDLKELLKKRNISSSHLVHDTSKRTILKDRIVSDQQQLLRIDYENSHSIQSATETLALEKFRSLLAQADTVVVEDYAKGALTHSLLKGILGLSTQENKIVAVDPNLRTPLSHYHGATLLTPNTKEAEFLSGVKITDKNSLLIAGLSILDQTEARYVVITRGKDGMAIFSEDSTQVKLIPTFAREVYDVSGAGDTVISVVILALSLGANIEEACILGNVAAGIEVSKRGTATVSREEIRHALGSVESELNSLKVDAFVPSHSPSM